MFFFFKKGGLQAKREIIKQTTCNTTRRKKHGLVLPVIKEFEVGWCFQERFINEVGKRGRTVKKLGEVLFRVGIQ